MPQANILIVEDERIVAEDLRQLLQTAGYGVPAVVATGEAAVVAAGRHRPHLVLMDIMLAGAVDGIAAACQINALFDLPVVYLTAYSDQTILERARATYPAGYILKPFSEKQLLTTVELALHTHQATRRTTEFPTLAGRATEEAPGETGPIRVLLVEDDPDDALLLREALAEADGRPFRVQHADRLAAGLTRLAQGGVDLIVLDLSLPDSQGLETLCAVRMHAAETPIVVMSGRADQATAVEAVRLGAQDYLVKGRMDSWLVARTLHHALERQRLYQAVQASEARARQVIESATDAIVVMDQDGRVQMANPATGALLGRPAAGLVGEPFGFPITAGESRELTLTRDDGETAVAAMRVAAVAWEGQPAHLAVLRDITERKWAEQALQESAASLAEAQRIAHIGSWEWNLGPDAAIWSAETYRTFGVPHGNLDEHREFFLDFIHPDDRTRVTQALDDAVSGVRQYDIEYRILLRDGTPKVIHALAEVVRNHEGQAVSLRGTVQDITERKRLEMARRVLSDVLDALNTAPAVAGAFPSVAAALRTLTGCARVSLTLFDERSEWSIGIALDQPHPDLDHGTRRLLAENAIAEDVLAGRVYLAPDLIAKMDFPMQRALCDAGYRSSLNLPLRVITRITGSLNLNWHEPAGYDTAQLPVLDQIADAVALAVEKTRLLDETRRHAARSAALAEVSQTIAQARLDTKAVADKIAECAGGLIGETAVVTLVSADGEWLDPVAVYHLDPAIQAFARSLLTANRQRIGEGSSGRVAQTGVPALVPVVPPTPAPQTIRPEYQPFLDRVGVASLLIVPLRAEGAVIGTLGLTRSQPDHPYTTDDQAFLQNLADRTALAIANARLFTEIRELNVALEQRVAERTAQLEIARDEARRANHAKSEFLSRMSHELRTPLNSILGFAQLLEMNELAPKHAKGVGYILKAGRHLLDLINEVLDLARIESGRLSISPEPVQLHGVIRETLDIVRPLADARRLTLELADAPADDLFVRADRQRLKQVLLNLLSNAIKYNREGGRVIVDCGLQITEPDPQSSFRNPHSAIRIRVSDTGPGITPENLAQLFDPFERIGAEQTETEGTGLGLAVAKKLMEAMGGRIGVASTHGQGSTFWLELPQVNNPRGNAPRMGAPAGIVVDQIKTGTVLYVEDDPASLQLVEEILASRPAIKLITATQGRLALDLALAQEHLPDLILLDLNLPDLRGEDVLRRLRAEPKTQAIPVVVLSADATPDQIERLEAAGAQDYLTKPLDVRQLLQVVDKIVGG